MSLVFTKTLQVIPFLSKRISALCHATKQSQDIIHHHRCPRRIIASRSLPCCHVLKTTNRKYAQCLWSLNSNARGQSLGQLILAKLVNKLPRFYKIQWIIAKKTAFGQIRNTTKPGSFRSPRGNNTDVEISYCLINVVEVSGSLSADVLVFRCLHDGCWSSDSLLNTYIMKNVCPDVSEEHAASIIRCLILV